MASGRLLRLKSGYGGGERQIKRQKAKGKSQKCLDSRSVAGARQDAPSALLTFAFCLLPFDLPFHFTLTPRYTVTPDPSAKNADLGAQPRAPANSGPYKLA